MVQTATIACATGYAMSVSQKERTERALKILADILSNLPPPLKSLHDHHAKLQAALLAELTFLAAQQGNVGDTRTLAMRCFAKDISWALNLGMVKLLLNGGRPFWPIPVQQHMARHS